MASNKAIIGAMKKCLGVRSIKTLFTESYCNGHNEQALTAVEKKVIITDLKRYYVGGTIPPYVVTAYSRLAQ